MIPRQISFYWHGGPLSFCRWLTLKSFRHFNPDWEIRLYRPAEVHSLPPDSAVDPIVDPAAGSPWQTHEKQDFFRYGGADYRPRIAELNIAELEWPHNPLPGADPVQQSDLFQWRMLAEVGGFYADLDILWVRPLDSLYAEVCEADTMAVSSEGNLSIGFLASGIHPLARCNLFFRDVLAVALRMYCPHRYQCCGVEAVSSVLGLDWRFVKDTRPKEAKTKDFGREYGRRYHGSLLVQPPDSTVYPFTWRQTGRIWKRRLRDLPAGCYGIHWFAGDPLSQKRNCELTENNLGEYQCTWAHFARQVLG